LEEGLARRKGTEAALVFPSGFQTNAGILPVLVRAGDCVIMDRLNHASLWDAAKMSGARLFAYEHRDPGALEMILRRAHEYRRKIVVTDSVFSMDGDCAPLAEVAALANRYEAWTMIDEAHATGIFGEHGHGLAEHCGVEGKIDIVMGTLSKALGSQGGYVCGKRQLIELIINKSRPFIYSTALAPACAAAALAALALIDREPDRRRSLLARSSNLRIRLKDTGFDTGASESQIIPVLTGTIANTLRVAEQLFERGVFAPAIRPPTVPENECRIRFSVTCEHTDEDLRYLVDAMRAIGQQ
jgi:8-amino-7-oxononanoate synthase